MVKDFATTLKYDEEIVKGLVVDRSEMEITQITRLPRTGSDYLARVDVVVVREAFCEWGKNLDLMSQGTKRLSLSFFWGKCATYIIK